MKTKRLWRIVGWTGLVGLLLALPVFAAPTEPHRAGVVIDFGDGRVETYCVTFTESSLTGYQLLERTGVTVAAAFEATGAAVCRIGGADGAGCASSNCFCQFPKYWSYWNQQGDTWVYANVGASSAQVGDGAVNGWLWGDASQPPSFASLDAICASADPTPTPTPTPTASPTPTPTATPPNESSASHGQAAEPTATPEPYVNFWADAEVMEAGTCVLLHWESWGMIEMRLDGEIVNAQGTETVCPCERQAYELEATYPDGSTEILTVKIDVAGECTGGGMAIMVTATPTASTADEASPTPTPTIDRRLPSPTPNDERGADSSDAPPASLPSTPNRFLSILPTPTAPPLPPTATPTPAPALLGDVTPSPELAAAATLTPEGKVPLPEGTAALLATPGRHLLDEPGAGAAITASTYLSAPVEGLTEAPEAMSPVSELLLQNWGGYVTFGALLVALGGAHLFIQRRNA